MAMKRGDKNDTVKYLQTALRIMCCYNGERDSTFGPATEAGVIKYQSNNGLTQDGMVGPATWTCLKSDIQSIQEILKRKGYFSGNISGIAYDDTYAAVQKFQAHNELEVDGRIGPVTRIILFDTLKGDYESLPFVHGQEGTYVIFLQIALRMLCFSPGSADGKFGSNTESAVKRYQTKNGLPVTGTVDVTTWDSIKGKILQVEQKLSSLNYSLGKIDGIATYETRDALCQFQADNNLATDWQIGPATRKALFGTTVEGGNDDFPLKRGSQGARVRYLQQGLRIVVINPNGTDGTFGPGCENAVKRYQTRKGLASTGVVDETTWAKLCEDIRPIQVALKNKGYYIPDLNGVADDDTYGAVCKYQTDNGMTADGMVGPATKTALLGGSNGSGTVSYVQKLGSNGALALYLQRMLNVLGYNVPVDGVFKEETRNAILSFQTENSLDPDGQVGPATWTKLFQLYKVPVSKIGIEKFVEVAKHELAWNYQEDNSNNITPYGQWYGSNGNPWCAMFVSWCAYQAGIIDSIVPRYAWCPAGASWYKSRGLYRRPASGYVPKIGDVIFFYNAEKGRVAHTGIVIGGSRSIVSTIEGNSSDGVNARIYSLGDASIDGYGDNNGTPIYESTPAVTDADIEIKMKEFFHDLLLPFGVDINITDDILANGYSIPTGDPNITLTTRIARDMVFGSGNIKATVENGEFQLSTDLSDTLSVAFGSIDPTKAQSIKALMDSITLSIDSGVCEISYAFTMQQIEITVRFSTEIEVTYGLNYEIGVEYKLTYKAPDDPTSPAAEVYLQNYNNVVIVEGLYNENSDALGVAWSVLWFCLLSAFFIFGGPADVVTLIKKVIEKLNEVTPKPNPLPAT